MEEEVNLMIDSKEFKVRKNVLCKHSDYFRAMFSGNYKENEQTDITIDVVDSNSMTLIVQYMNNGLIDLSDIPILDDLALSANFLLMGELIKQIEQTLLGRLSISNWLTTKDLAQSIASVQLEQAAVTFGVLSFQSMKPEFIPTLRNLHWYLSHPYLEIFNELQIFKFGFDWVVNANLSADALLIVLGCLDITALTTKHLKEMAYLLSKFEYSLPTRIVQCLLEVSKDHALTYDNIYKCKMKIHEKYTEHVFTEILSIIKMNCVRKLKMVPCVPLTRISENRLEIEAGNTKKSEDIIKEGHYIYRFREGLGFEKWIEVAPNSLWGWSVTSWGRTKLVVVGGEYGKGTGIYMREVAVYDTLQKKWVRHGVTLPAMRHSGIVVIRNFLYILGGVGSFRVLLSSAVEYDLENRSFRKIANISDAMQSPAVCEHDGELYVSGQTNIYKFDALTDRWQLVLYTNIRATTIASFGGYIYLTQSYFMGAYKFRPGEDTNLKCVQTFTRNIITLCNLGNRLVVFSKLLPPDVLSIEMFDGDVATTIWTDLENEMDKYWWTSCCALVFREPPINPTVSQYPKKYLSLFHEES